MTPAQLLAAHPGVRLLTLDLFDTLVTRSVAQPTHVFALMERDLAGRDPGKWQGFARERVLAERRARREAAGISEHSDVTIEDIVRELAAELGLGMAERSMLVELEKQTEIAVTRAVPFGAGLVAEARGRGLQVLVVSDNYMPSVHLAGVAAAAGLDITEADIVVSSENGAMKHDGSLWSVVLARTGLEPREILHVGDLADADGTIPARLGIATHVQPAMRVSQREPLNTSPAILPLSFIEAANRDSGADAARNVATGAFALVVAGQVIDAASAAREKGAVGVHFTSRDGWLAHRVYGELRKSDPGLPPHTYTAVSRSLVWRASLGSLDGTSVTRFIGDDERLTRAQACARLGLPSLPHERGDEIVDAVAARALLLGRAAEAEERCRSLRAEYLDYLAHQGVTAPGHHVLVDLGWTGSVVSSLGKMVTEETRGAATFEARLVGLYWDATPHRSVMPLHGLAVDELCPLADNMRLLGVIRLFESLLTAPHGTVTGFRGGDAEWSAGAAVPGLRGADWHEMAEQIVETAANMVLDRHPSVRPAEIDRSTVWAAMMQLGHTPTAREVALLSAVRHETALDHAGPGDLLVAEAAGAGPAGARIEDTYDRLLRHSWLGGSLASWEASDRCPATAMRVREHQPWTDPVWVDG